MINTDTLINICIKLNPARADKCNQFIYNQEKIYAYTIETIYNTNFYILFLFIFFIFIFSILITKDNNFE
tara:strand:+ start:275 stop:484 length:210 start_codon:yes stop_codon:yes gene_type:complete